jgi:hypothetical protein
LQSSIGIENGRPLQRVDLYDECVDVLLGQRKEAERIQMSKTSGSLDEHAEQSVHYERKWVRKRFSEIALELLRSDEEEITRQEVIELLIPRFVDRGADDAEKAEADANTFLERQELRSGLLVSRMAHRYRFVHLTFQEYLAAWHLSTRELTEAKQLIQPNLREPEWFETLQLLGAELGKRSDESLDSYVAYLLDQLGTTISEQAPIIALCANIINDVAGVAEVTPTTRRRFQEALKNTLGAFQGDSGVSAKTQLEILAPLANLGAAVKEHLISATKSAYYPVRSAALSFLAPHLPDNDLFGMTHVLSDRSMVTIRTYLAVLYQRDAQRTIDTLAKQTRYTEKCATIVTAWLPTMMTRATEDEVFAIASLAHNAEWWARPHSLQILASIWPNRHSTWEFISKCARDTRYWFKRQSALKILINASKDTETDWASFIKFIEKGGSLWYDQEIKFLIEHKGKDAATWSLISTWAIEHKDHTARAACLTTLSREQRYEKATWSLIIARSIDDPSKEVRLSALQLLWRSGSPAHRTLVTARAEIDPVDFVRTETAKLIRGEAEQSE